MYPYVVVTKVHEQDAHATSECPNFRAPWERNVYRIIQVKIGKRSVRCAIFFLQAEDGIRHVAVTGVQTCALPISASARRCGTPSQDSRSRIPCRRRRG